MDQTGPRLSPKADIKFKILPENINYSIILINTIIESYRDNVRINFSQKTRSKL